MLPRGACCRRMKPRCAKSSERMYKSSQERLANATWGTTHNSTRPSILSKVLFRELVCGPEETAIRCRDKRATISKQKSREVARSSSSSARITTQTLVRLAQMITELGWLQRLRSLVGPDQNRNTRYAS